MPLGEIGFNIFGMILLGLIIGCLSGFLGVGGGFLITPFLNIIFGIPYNIAVGSGLAQMVFTSAAGVKAHMKLRNVDFKLGLLLFMGTLFGVRLGVQIVEALKIGGHIIIGEYSMPLLDFYMTIFYFLLLFGVGSFILLEIMKKKSTNDEGIVKTPVSDRLCMIKIPPLIPLNSGEMSFWVIWLMGVLVGALSGLLGVGGGFILLPMMIYCLCVPTNVSIGTSLFQVFLTSSYASFSHAFLGNVDIRLTAYILIGSLIGVQGGIRLNKAVTSANARKYFAYILFFAAALVLMDFLIKIMY